MRDNDMVALMLFNPEATMLDLDASGINIENTGIKDEQEYLKLNQVRDNPKFKDNNGNFSDSKFHEFYIDALKQYNILAQGGWQPTFSETDIFAPAKLRKQSPDFQEVHVENPFQKTKSFKDIGEWGPQTKSVREIAEGQQVYNTETGEWMDSPETSFFGTIGMGPLVLATWDFDADENGNPTSDPDEVKYKKGTPKLNDKGTFYYETLGNRSSYGKDILHYSDIITKEDSKWNKIDFLDSDDLEKSVMGTVAKNVALVGSMFLPGGVGYAVTAATLLQQSLKLGATLGKMLLGSESQSMNSFQALISATDLHESTSDYARNKMWSWENLINTAGDAIAQLRQQRILFEAVPWALGYGGLGKGKGVFTEEGQKALKEKFLKEQANIPLNITEKNKDLMSMLTESQKIAYMKDLQASVAANNMTKQLTNLSGAVSKAYMTGITVNDMFEEAKEAGMGDMGAIAMTLGYAAAEYALLSTGIGEMILPELRAQRMQNKQLLKNLTKVKDKSGTERSIIEILNESEAKATTDEAKKNFFWKAFNVGKRLWEDNRSGTAKALTNATVAAFGEGVEEVSEEFLADAIRCIHDLGHWSEGKMLDTDKMFDRYAMNFVGGFIGGGVNGLVTDFSVFNRLSNLSAEDSMKQLIYKINNGEADEIKRDIEKTEWASKDLSATKMVYDEKTKRYVWQQAENERDSQNETIKTQLRNQINSVINVLEANGAKIKEGDLFDYNTLKEARFAMLANTSTAARYSEVFTTRLYDLIKNHEKSVELDASLTDEQKRDTESEQYKNYERQKAELEKERKEIVKEIDEIKQGKQAARFIGTALLEIHPAVAQSLITGPTLDLFVRRTHPNKKSFRELTDEEKQEYLQKYKDYKGGFGKDEVIAAYDTWERLMEAIQTTFMPEIKTYEKEQDKYSQFLDTWLNATNNSTNDPNKFLDLANIFLGFLDERELSDLDEKVFGQTKLKTELEKIQQSRKDDLEKITDSANKIIDIQNVRRALLDENDENHEAEVANLKKIQDILNNLKQEQDNLRAEYNEARANAISDGKFASEEEYDNSKLEKLAKKLLDLDNKYEEQLKAIDDDYEFKVRYINGLNEIEKTQEIINANQNYDKAVEDHAKNAKEINNLYDASLNVRFYRYIADNFINLINLSKESGYINPVTKDKLKRSLERLNYIIPKLELFGAESLSPGISTASGLSEEIYDKLLAMLDEDNSIMEDIIGAQTIDKDYNVITTKEGKFHQIRKSIEDVLNTPDSPILKLLDAFALDVTGQQTNFSGLLSNINATLDASKTFSGLNINSNADQIEFNELLLSQIEQAIKLTDLLYSVLMGARSDSAGFEQNKQLSTDIPNFGFHFGINSIINEVKKKMGDDSAPFLTIEGNITDNIVRDLHLLSNNLKFLQNLYGINSGQKLNTQSRITLHSTQIIYKALRKLCDTIPDDIDKSMLLDFFKEGNIINQNLDKTSVDDATLEKIEAERIKLEDALYDFGQKNKGKNFIDFNKYQEIFTPSSLILNETTPEFDISSLIGYLASRFAIKSSTFYNNYRKVISDDIAPLSIQELGIYLQTANALNGQVITDFKNVITKSMQDYLRNLTLDKRTDLYKKIFGENLSSFLAEDVLQDLIIDSLVPQYDNVTFLEGIAGSGKTRAVMLMTAKLLDSVNKNIMENAFIIDTSEENAIDLAEKGLGLKERKYKAFSKETLLQYISDWKEPNSVNGNYQYEEGKDYIVENGIIVPAYNLKEGIELPSIIVIDEVGRYTDLELKTIDNFAKKHGISVLTFGDLDQTRATGTADVKIKELTKIAESHKIETVKDDIFKAWETNISRIQLIHGPKLGFSMRTRNKQQDKNQEIMLAKLIDPKGDINLSYYEGQDQTGNYILNGAKVINFNSSNLSNKEDEIISLLEKLIPTLEDNEKIGFIFQSKESSLYQKIIDKFGKDKFDFYQGNTAQGKEAKYFVYETGFGPKTDNKQIVNELYTGITRAQKGIIILTQNPGHTEGITNIKNQNMDSSTQDVSIPSKSIQQFSQKRKQMYDNIFGDSTEKLEYIERGKISLDPINNTIPKFELVEQRIDGDRIIIDIKPYSLKDSNWLSGSRTLNTVVQLSCDLRGYNVQIELKDGDQEESISYSGHISDIIDGINTQDDGINPDKEMPQSEEQTEEIVRKTTPPILNPPPVREVVITTSGENWNPTVHSNASANSNMQILLYTLASMETGLVGEDLSQINGSKRIDSIRGLYKMMPNSEKAKYGTNLYKHLYETLLELHSIFLRSDNKVDLITEVSSLLQRRLGLTGTDVKIQFGLWTSSRKNTAVGTRFEVFERSRDASENLLESSDFNDIDSGDENIHPRNISAVITTNGKSILLPLALLSSPLTIARNVDESGNQLYPEVMQILNNNDKGMYERIVEILNNNQIYQKYPALYNLFKLYIFTHNGFFPLKQINGNIQFGWDTDGTDEFTLQKTNNYGIQVITNRGQRQFNEDTYQEHLKLSEESRRKHPQLSYAQVSGNFRPITDVLPNIQLGFSKQVYMFKEKPKNANDGNKEMEVLLGRPFVFVTEDPDNIDYNNDEKLFDKWIEHDPKVRLVYLLPPILTFEQYINRLVDFDNGIGKQPGNNITSYHILSTLLKSEEGKKLIKSKLSNQFSEGLSLYNQLLDIIEDLDRKYEDGQREFKRTGVKGAFKDFIDTIYSAEGRIFKNQKNLYDKLNKLVRLIIDKHSGFINLSSTSELESRVRNIDKDPDAIKIINNIIKDQFVIYDAVRFDNTAQEINGMLPISHDAVNNYTINGQPLLMDTKVTTPTFGTNDLNSFIDQVVNYQIHVLNGTNQKIGNDQMDIELAKEVFGLFNGVLPQSKDQGYTAKSKRYEKLGILEKPKNKEEEERLIEERINQINSNQNEKRIIIQNKNSDTIYELTYNDELKNLSGTKSFVEDGIDENGYKKYILTIGENKYNVIYDESSSGYIFIKQQEENLGEGLTIDEIKNKTMSEIKQLAIDSEEDNFAKVATEELFDALFDSGMHPFEANPNDITLNDILEQLDDSWDYIFNAYNCKLSDLLKNRDIKTCNIFIIKPN